MGRKGGRVAKTSKPFAGEKSAEGKVSMLKVAVLRIVLLIASGENGAVGRSALRGAEEEVSCGGEMLILWRSSEVKLAAEFQQKKGLIY